MFVAADSCETLNRERVFETYPGRAAALGDLQISRALPVRGRRLIGPWCFLDLYGPLSFTDDKPMDVAPHPHIGLQTVSLLFEGEVVHHDSLGAEGVVRPGGVNVMTSGGGIAHSEETPRRNSGRLHGVQLWVALPDAVRNAEAAFHAIESVPEMELVGGSAQLFMGTLGDQACAAPAFSDIVGLDATVHRGETLIIPVPHRREHGVVILDGDATFENQPLERDAIHYLGCGRSELSFKTSTGARLLVVGGEPFGEKILMWWNFVARTPEEIAEARADWQERRRFGEVLGYSGRRLDAPALGKLAPANPAS